MSSRRWLRRLVEDLRAAGVALLIFFLILGPAGGVVSGLRHCPTASVQHVYDPLSTVMRSVQPGDSAFRACECGKKSAASKADSYDQAQHAAAVLAPPQNLILSMPRLRKSYPPCGITMSVQPGFGSPYHPPPVT